MHVTSLEIILAVVAVFIVFGPKRLPERSQPREKAIKMEKERVNVRPGVPPQPALAPHTYAAGRAPSPLQLRAAERPLRPAGQVDETRPQFATKDVEGSPLPHEMLRV